MRRHVGAMFLLGGWLLMNPPSHRGTDGGLVLEENKPLSKWNQFSSYDTAAECEKRRMALSGTETKDPELQSVMARARCVPAESIYPPK